MGIHITEFVSLGTLDAVAMASGDALGAQGSFSNVPEHGLIASITVVDQAKQSANLDVMFFRDALGTTYAHNAVFSPSDAENLTSVGSYLVDTWKAQDDNSLGCVTNVGLPYWAPAGVLYFQCVTRGTPTYTAAADVHIRLGIIT